MPRAKKLQPQFEAGDHVVFTNFTGDVPKNGDLLEVDEVYEVLDVQQEGDEFLYGLKVENPEFNEDKRASKNNPTHMKVDVFGDEIEASEDDEEEQDEEEQDEEEQDEEEQDEEEQDEEEQDEEEETSTTTRGKRKTKKKTSKTSGKKASRKVAKSEEQEDDESEVDIILKEEEEDEEVLDLIRESDDLIDLAQSYAQQTASAEWRLGGILYHVKVSKQYREYEDGAYNRKGGWADFVNAVLGVEYRKSQYLIDIYSKFSRFGLTGEVAATIGWTKAAVISAVMKSKKDAKALVKLASDSTVADLKDEIKTVYKEGGERQVVAMTRFKFAVVEEDGQMAEKIIQACMKTNAYKKESEAFMHIMSEWGAEHLETTKTKGKSKTTGKAATKTTGKTTTRTRQRQAA